MRTTFAVGRLTRETAEIVILERARASLEAPTGRALRTLVRLARACLTPGSGTLH